MSARRKFSFEELVEQGRGLLDARDPTATHSAFLNWDRNVAEWLDEAHPESGASADWSSQPMSNLVTGRNYFDDPPVWTAFRKAIQSRLAWLARFAATAREKQAVSERKPPLPTSRVFVVHGHNEGVRESVARFLERLQLEPVVLHEQPSKGRTIIEKFTDYAEASYAVVLLTADDRGGTNADEFAQQRPRARQNVILELGYFLGRLGRERVCALYEDNVEIPSDYDGVIFVPLAGDWQLRLARELKAAGLPVDMNRAV